jgi:hypothetical protein
LANHQTTEDNMTAHRYLCFVHGDAWVWTNEGGTQGPITSEEDLELPLAADTEVPETFTTGMVQTSKPTMTREEFYRLRTDAGIQHSVTLMIGLLAVALTIWLLSFLV